MSINKQNQRLFKQHFQREQAFDKTQNHFLTSDLETANDEHDLHDIHGQGEHIHDILQNTRQNITMNEYADWRKNWQQSGQPWRAEREIDAQRQNELLECYAIEPDIQQGCYPFRNIAKKLRRADIEWLLSLQLEKAAHQSVPQHYLSTHGLDLRGADLSKVDLRGLPLMHMRGGLFAEDWRLATQEQREMAAVHMERTNLRGAFLQGAMLRGAHLEGADLQEAHLEGADLQEAHLEGKASSRKSWSAADLRMAFFDSTTQLKNVVLGDEAHSTVRIADVHWNGVSISSIAWKRISILGDELEARQWRDIDSYREALRANRQLSTALRSEGFYEEANYFAYRSYVNHRALLRRGLILPLVLRLLQHPQMPLPLLFRRAEQWWGNQPGKQHNRVLPFMLMRMMLLFLLLIFLAVLQPITTTILLCLSILPFVLFYLLLIHRAHLPETYQPAQVIVLSPKYVSSNQRLRQKHLLLLHFLLGKPVTTIRETLPCPWKFPRLLLFLATLDNTITYSLKYLFSLFLDLLMGYGYKLGRALCWYILTLFLFALIYIHFSHFSPQSSFLLSLASFHGRAFFSLADLVSDNIMGIVEVIESCIGLFIEICFLIILFKYRPKRKYPRS